MEYAIETTGAFDSWLSGLKDRKSRARVLSRLDRVELGNFGDHKRLGDDLWEFRFSFGGGLRIYYCLRGETVVLLLCGGNKSGQGRDIAKAKQIFDELE